MSKISLLKELVSDIERLQEAEQIVDEIFTELGPYSNALSSKLQSRINDFVKFDDGE